MPTKIVATFDVEHPTHGTTLGEGVHLRLYACMPVHNLHCVELVNIQI